MEEATKGRPKTRDAEVDGDHRHRNTAEGGAARRRALRGQPKEPGAHPRRCSVHAEARLDQADKAIAIAVFVALGSVTVGGAVLFYVVDAKRAARPLEAIKRFMSDNNAVIMMVVLLLLGAKLLGDGDGVL